MEVKDHVHRNGQRNELRNWSMEKLAAHPAGAALYAGRYWQFLGDNKIYYSPDGVVIKPIGGDAARLALGVPKVTLVSNHQDVIFDMQQDSEAMRRNSAAHSTCAIAESVCRHAAG